MPNQFKQLVCNLLDGAQISINGSNPWDIRIYKEDFFDWLLHRGSLGLGEAYVAGLWDCERLDEFMYRIMKSNLEERVVKSMKILVQLFKAKVFNQQTSKRAWTVGERHYDLGNELYEAMLDRRMIYSCAYWDQAGDLDQAQEKKLDLICRKLQLQSGQRLLDIGCGWGGLAEYAAQRYNVEVVGVTISREQAQLARKRCANLPVEIWLQDYRSLRSRFDRIVSVGMFEHVGYKNYATFMDVVRRNLREDGLFLLHCIGGNSSVTMTDPWINTYIFPNGMMPSVAQIGRSAENKFILEDWHNFGNFYDLTLMEWLRRFKNAWPCLKKKYDDHFYRMWEYYLSCSAASFRAKKNNLWQIVFSPPSNLNRYVSIR